MSASNGSSKTSRALTAIGEAQMTGIRGKAGRAVARPIADRTRWSQEQIEAAIGLAIMLYGLYRLMRPAFRALREA